MGQVYSEGFQWHLPWNRMDLYKTQWENREEHLAVLSSDGATIKMDVSIWFRPVTNTLDSLQIKVGRDYYSVVVAPALRGEARRVVGKFKPEEIYSTKREEIIIDAYLLNAEHVCPDDRKGFFRRVSRCYVFLLCTPLRCRQLVAINFAIGRQGECIEVHKCGRNHVVR